MLLIIIKCYSIMSFEFTFHTRKIFSLNFIVVYIYHTNFCYLVVIIHYFLLLGQKAPFSHILDHSAPQLDNRYYSSSEHIHLLFIPSDPEYPMNNKLVLFFQPYPSSFQLFVFFSNFFLKSVRTSGGEPELLQ